MNHFNGLSQALRAHVARVNLPAYTVADVAPSNHIDLLRCYNVTGKLVIWAGCSDRTIWGGPADNWRFRAWHDLCHIKSGMCDKVDCFTANSEIELSRFQCLGLSDGLGLAVDIEIAGQAGHYAKTGRFVDDQIRFALDKGL
jgi:hypothetical protein